MVNDPDLQVWEKRLGRVVRDGFAFIHAGARHQRTSVAVRAVPKRVGDRSIVYRYGVRGEPAPWELDEALHDVLNAAGSVLEIAMFTVASKQASPPLTPHQDRKVVFPIAATERDWNALLGQPHMRALSVNQVKALHAMQPFMTGNDVMAWFRKIYNDDRHRRPLELKSIPDPEFVMLFMGINPPMGAHRDWLDWVDPVPPIANGIDFVEYRSTHPILDATLEEVPITLAIWIGGKWWDVQHLLWDVMEFVVRASAVLAGRDLAHVDVLRDYFAAERAQLDAFKTMMSTASRSHSRIDPDLDREWQRLSAQTVVAADRFEKVFGARPPGHTADAFRKGPRGVG